MQFARQAIFGLLLFTGACAPRVDSIVVRGKLAEAGESVDVQVVRDKELVDVEPGMKLKEADVLTTGSDHTVKVTTREADFTVYPRSTMTLGDKEVITDIATIAISARKAVRARSSSTVSGTRGTEYFFEELVLGDQRTVKVTVISGVVSVSSPTNAFSELTLRPREQVVVAAKPEPVRTLGAKEFNDYVNKQNDVQRVIGKGAKFLMPGVVGQPEPDANGLLSQWGFAINRVPTIEGNEDQMGKVVRQDPDAGTRVNPTGVTVRLHVRVRAVDVPSVIGLSLSEARRVLHEAELVGERAGESISGQFAAGEVNSQEPSASAQVPESTTVRLIVEAESVVVPDVRGIDLDSARRTVAEARLELNVGGESFRAGIERPEVERQKPAAGARVSPGTVVSVDVLNPGFAVPRLIDLSRQAAERALAENGLRLGRVTEEHSTRYKAGRVLHQAYGADTLLGSGASVDIVVSKGPEQCSVPQLAPYRRSDGRWQYTYLPEARQKLASAGLQLVIRGSAPPRDREGKYYVQEQDISPNSRVDCGSPVGVRLLRVVE